MSIKTSRDVTRAPLSNQHGLDRRPSTSGPGEFVACRGVEQRKMTTCARVEVLPMILLSEEASVDRPELARSLDAVGRPSEIHA